MRTGASETVLIALYLKRYINSQVKMELKRKSKGSYKAMWYKCLS